MGTWVHWVLYNLSASTDTQSQGSALEMVLTTLSVTSWFAVGEAST